jgi:hypothetical protein
MCAPGASALGSHVAEAIATRAISCLPHTIAQRSLDDLVTVDASTTII